MLESGTTTWNEGWYVVPERGVTIGTRITVNGDVKLILRDNATLTASQGITVVGNNKLTIYAQSKGSSMGALIATAAVVLPSFIIILLIMILLKKALKNPYVQAVLRGLKPCMTGIILATGVFMILQRCDGSIGEFSVDTTALILTLVLAGIYFGSRRILKNGISPIGLIAVSALVGIAVYGL